VLSAPGVSARSPQIDYMLHCQGCHLPDGGGTGEAVPPLRDFVGRFLTVPGGREFLVRVPGSAQSPLSDAALAAVLNWIVREFGPAAIAADFEPFDSEEVTKLRGEPLAEVDSVRRKLVEQME
jgi:hypothetical protein